MRRRREWFSRMTGAFLALWCVPAGHHSTVAEGVARLERLRADGPTPHALTLRLLSALPEDDGERVDPVDLPGERPAL
jgi:hypothetical protein